MTDCLIDTLFFVSICGQLSQQHAIIDELPYHQYLSNLSLADQEKKNKKKRKDYNGLQFVKYSEREEEIFQTGSRLW